MSSDGLTWKTRLELYAYAFLLNLFSHPDGKIDRWLLNAVEFKSRPSATPIGGVKSFDHTIDASRDLWFRTFVPVDVSSSTPLPVLIYYHGGGFVSFSPSTKQFDGWCRRLAAAIPAVIISVNYRLAPEHKLPAQYEDGFDAVKFIDGNRDRIEGFPANADLSRCFLAGDSAGANLIHHMAVRIAAGLGHGFGSIRVRGLVAIQPFFGGEERTGSELRLANSTWLKLKILDFYWKAFLPVGSNRDHPAVNVTGPGSKDISGLDLPPVLVVVGGKDPLQDWQRRYYHLLKGSGKETDLAEYPNVVHAFYASVDSRETATLAADIKEFVDRHLRSLD